MDWDLGFRGLLVLAGMALLFGLFAQLVLWRLGPWVWPFAAAGYFAGGIFVSEVWFGWATEEDLQPNIDGLSFDEVLLLDTLFGIVIVVAVWFVRRRVQCHHPASV